MMCVVVFLFWVFLGKTHFMETSFTCTKAPWFDVQLLSSHLTAPQSQPALDVSVGTCISSLRPCHMAGLFPTC